MKCLATQDTFKEDFFCIRLVDDSGSTHDALVTQNAITFKSICFTCFFSRRVLMRQELSCAKESDGVAENDQEKINTHTPNKKNTHSGREINMFIQSCITSAQTSKAVSA